MVNLFLSDLTMPELTLLFISKFLHSKNHFFFRLLQLLFISINELLALFSEVNFISKDFILSRDLLPLRNKNNIATIQKMNVTKRKDMDFWSEKDLGLNSCSTT